MIKTMLRIAPAMLLLLSLSACKHDETPTDTSGSVSTSDTMDTATPSSTGTTATTSTGSSGGSTSSLTQDDKEFVMKAGSGGLAEVDAGTMASSKAENAEVKSFADRMVADHRKANEELKTLATNKGIALPTATDNDHHAMIEELAKKSGKEFDKAYVAAMVKDHEEDVSEFVKASQNATDPDLKSWATATLPILQGHLKMIKDIESRLK